MHSVIKKGKWAIWKDKALSIFRENERMVRGVRVWECMFYSEYDDEKLYVKHNAHYI